MIDTPMEASWNANIGFGDSCSEHQIAVDVRFPNRPLQSSWLKANDLAFEIVSLLGQHETQRGVHPVRRGLTGES